MSEKVNTLRNPTFVHGKAGPRCWVYSTTSQAAKWQRGLADHAHDKVGIRVISQKATGSAFWSQIVTCQPGKHYRVEATVECNLTADHEDAGFVLAIEPASDGQPDGPRRVTPGIHRASEPLSLRTTYQAPDGARQVRISVGVVNARGTARIHEVRFIKILEPDEISHAMAIPPLPFTMNPPKSAETVCVCSKNADTRPITGLLAAYLGGRHVLAVSPGEFQSTTLKTDALLLPDPSPPPSIRSLRGLIKLAEHRVVVVSLSAFAQLCRAKLSLRRIEQTDDPICAKVAYGNCATRGFALHDTFAYAWSGREPGSFVQIHFRKTRELKEFCKRHGFETFLLSVCDQDVTSDRPIGLFKESAGGGLFVLDINPAEAASSTLGEPALALHLLLSILGQPQTHLGQFIVPVPRESEFRAMLREMDQRFDPFVVHDADVPVEEVTEQLVTVGREDQMCGLPLQPKPVILVRSGLISGDVLSDYASLIWFKQFIRIEPYACPYAQQLASQFRLAWVPCVARWESPDGWRRSGNPPTEPMTIEFEDAPMAAMIDVVSCRLNRVRVVLPRLNGPYARYPRWLGQLTEVFPPGSFFALGPPPGADFTDRDRFVWRRSNYDVQVVADPREFDSPAHHDVMAAGGDVVRIEIPGDDADLSAHSIHRTDLAATLLEQVIGLQLGLIAVNRATHHVQLDGLPPFATGEALVLDRRDPVLHANASRAG